MTAESGVNRAEFHADVATADDQEVLRDVGQLQRFVRSHDPFVAKVESIRHGWLRADRNDCFLIANEFLPVRGLDPEGLGILEVAATVHDLHAAVLSERLDALAEFFEDRLFPIPQSIKVDFWPTELDATLRRVRGLTQNFSRVEQRLRGNAADVEANPTKPPILFDQRHLFPFIRGIKSRRISPGSGA